MGAWVALVGSDVGADLEVGRQRHGHLAAGAAGGDRPGGAVVGREVDGEEVAAAVDREAQRQGQAHRGRAELAGDAVGAAVVELQRGAVQGRMVRRELDHDPRIGRAEAGAHHQAGLAEAAAQGVGPGVDGDLGAEVAVGLPVVEDGVVVAVVELGAVAGEAQPVARSRPPRPGRRRRRSRGSTGAPVAPSLKVSVGAEEGFAGGGEARRPGRRRAKTAKWWCRSPGRGGGR